MKTTILTLLIAIIAAFNITQLRADDYSDAMKKTMKKFGEAAEKNDKAAYLKVRGDFERILQLKKNVWMVNYWLAFTDFMLARIASDEKNNEDVQKYTESAIDILNKSTDLKDDFSEAYVLKMAVQANRWSYEPNKMNDIIAKSTEAKDMAFKLDPNNPRYYLIDGYSTFYTPESFGGGYEKALPVFEKAWENYLTFKPVDDTYPDWGKEQAAGMIAMCYIKQDKLEDAKKWIDIALEVKPDSGFITDYVVKEYEKAKK